jgi:hypothetical protein
MKTKFLLIVFTLFGSILITAPAYADFNPFTDPCQGNQSSPVCKPVPPEQKNPILHIISVATEVLLLVTGGAAVIFIIVGALNLITSAGNAESVKKGRERIIYSLVGVAVAALAFTITRFLISELSK